MSHQLPDCTYEARPVLVRPATPTPTHTLRLSNLDDQKFLRFAIKYLYVYRNPLDTEVLRESLSRVLVAYYPLAGRLRKRDGEDKLDIECSGEGAVFAEANMELSAEEFLEFARKPNTPLRKLLYRVEPPAAFFDIPPLIVQVTNLLCGGIIFCIAINHCLCDGIGSSQFLHGWSHMYKSKNLAIQPLHSRNLLQPRSPPQVTFHHPGFTNVDPNNDANPQSLNIFKFLRSQTLVPSSITFSLAQILHLKRQCYPSLKCTTFEVLASHTWRCWVKSLALPLSLPVKLLFSVNIRAKMHPEIPQGYYGNGFVLACAETKVKELVGVNMHHGIKLVQHAKSTITNEYIHSIVDLLEDKVMTTDLTTSLVISQWSKLQLEELDFGQGKPLHMGPLTSDIYCLFLPVLGDFDAVRVLISMPECVINKFEFYMQDISGVIDNGDANNQYEVDNLKMVSV